MGKIAHNQKLTDYSAKEAAPIIGISLRHLQRQCFSGQIPEAYKKGNHWYLKPQSHPKLLKAITDNLIDSDELSGFSEKKRQQALKKLGIIQKFERFAANFVANNRTRSEAIIIFTKQNNIAKRTFERWLAKYRRQGMAGLLDNRGNSLSSESISPEAFEMFKSMYLTQQQRGIKSCWQNICFINKDQQKNWKIPSLGFMYRYVKQQIPQFVQILHREGQAAYEAKCAPYIEIDPDSIGPGQVWVGDHSQFNCWIRYRGKWIRPWITAWQDMRSRAIVGWHISASPNQTTILLAMKRAIEIYGPPESVKIDNGKDYDSEMWTGTTKVKRRILRKGYLDEQMVAGIYAMMNIAISFAIKYHPQSKIIERWFDTLDKQFTKTIPTYCGKDSERKPDYLNELLKSKKAINQAYDLNSFNQLVGKYIEVYNSAAHTGRGMNEKSPAEILTRQVSRRVIADGILNLLMRVWSGELIVGKNGVRFKGMYYGQYNPELLIYQGRKVKVSYDPDDLRKIYIYDSATMKLITIAEQNQLIQYGTAVSEENLRKAMSEKSHALKIAKAYRDKSLTANMDLTSLTIKAMQESVKRKTVNESVESIAKTLRPIRTPLDGQLEEHQRQEAIKAVRRASGAEGLKAVLDIDFETLKRKKVQTIDLGLFKNE